MDIPIEQRFKVLCEIVRAQHFAWREATLAMAPDLDPIELTNEMWRITGVQTAKAKDKSRWLHLIGRAHKQAGKKEKAPWRVMAKKLFLAQKN